MRQLTIDDITANNTRDVADQMARDLHKIVRGPQLRRLTERIGLDEAVSAGGLGIARAVRSYVPNHRTAFKTYAFVAITRALQHAADLQRRQASKLDDKSHDELSSLVDVSPVDAEHDSSIILDGLPEKFATILKRRYIDGIPVKDLARFRRISQQAVRQQIERAKSMAAKLVP